ncbi:TPA: hypothetical protein ACPSKE_002854 [Legionella feeleii]
MPRMTKTHTNSIKEIVLHYLHGEETALIRARLTVQAKALNCDGRTLIKSIGLPPDDAFITAILGSLAIPLERQRELLGEADNLYELLLLLYQDNHHHLKALFKLIDATSKPKSSLSVLLPVVGLTGSGALAFFNRDLIRQAALWLKETVSPFLNRVTSQILPRHLALAGLVYQVAGLGAQTYSTLSGSKKGTAAKAGSLIFHGLSAGFAIAAYTLCYLAAGLMTTTVASLFVASAGIDVLKGLVTLLQSLYTDKAASSLLSTDAPWEVLASAHRAESHRRNAWQTVGIKFSAATTSTAIVALWCFSPPGLLLSGGCMAAIALTGFAKTRAVSWNQARLAENLQHRLREIKVLPESSLCPSTHPLATHLKEKEKQQAMQDKALLRRKEALDLQQSAMSEVLIALKQGMSSPAKALLSLTDSNLPLQAANEDELDEEVLPTRQPRIDKEPPLNQQVASNDLEEVLRFTQ